MSTRIVGPACQCVGLACEVDDVSGHVLSLGFFLFFLPLDR